MLTLCTATTKAGTPCKARAATGSPYCLSHDPARSEQLAAARRKGGQEKATKRRAMRELIDRALTAEEYGGLIGAVALEVYTGKKSPAVANAIANLAKAATSVNEATVVEERIAALESALGIDQRKAG